MSVRSHPERGVANDEEWTDLLADARALRLRCYALSVDPQRVLDDPLWEDGRRPAPAQSVVPLGPRPADTVELVGGPYDGELLTVAWAEPCLYLIHEDGYGVYSLWAGGGTGPTPMRFFSAGQAEFLPPYEGCLVVKQADGGLGTERLVPPL